MPKARKKSSKVDPEKVTLFELVILGNMGLFNSDCCEEKKNSIEAKMEKALSIIREESLPNKISYKKYAPSYRFSYQAFRPSSLRFSATVVLDDVTVENPETNTVNASNSRIP